MITLCDMCGTEVKNNRCSCGKWTDNTEDHPTRKALESFHDMKQFTLTADAPHLGCAAVFFRGDYNDTKMVEKFIKEMKGRPYYNHMSQELWVFGISP